MPYQCEDCGAAGVKLWRPYNSFRVHLRCRGCAKRDAGKVGRPDSDQIGWNVPAVPVAGQEGAYWSYTSVPDDAVTWWEGLPPKLPCHAAPGTTPIADGGS